MRLRNIQRFQSRIQKKIGQKINKNLHENFERLTDIVEEVSEAIDSKSPKTVLNFALDVLKPYLRALGLRIARISEEQIEVILPEKFHNSGTFEVGSLDLQPDEGAICSAATFAFRQLWKRNSPKGRFSISVQKLSFERVREMRGDLSFRFELSKFTRETIFANLADKEKSESEFVIHVYNEAEQIVAEVHIIADLFLNKTLDWK